MRRIHRGHEINVTRERSMGGDSLLYFSIYRLSDGYECAAGFSYDESKVASYAKQMAERIDAELATDDPWCELGDAS